MEGSCTCFTGIRVNFPFFLLGEPFMALLLATIAAMYLLGTRHAPSIP